LLVHLLYYTAQRLNDTLSMRWSDIEDGRLVVRQDKTEKLIVDPASRGSSGRTGEDAAQGPADRCDRSRAALR
jgi:integrase